ncbi:MAG: BlaI/MecI/CopY family transcriptional regulator [Gemmatimonadota bacterium]
MTDQHQLTDLQTSILRLLWQRGEATVAEIWEELYAERGLAQTTIATIVARLQRRGILARRNKDRQFVYRPLITEADVQHSMVKELTERLFDGDVTALVSHLIADRDMTPGDLERVRQMIENASPGKGEAK